jgi:Ulp1 family protease
MAEEMHAVAGVLNSLPDYYKLEIRKGIREYLASAFGHLLGRQEVKDIQIGRQPNGSDCGTITIANCISALRDKPYQKTWTLDQCNKKRVWYLMKIYDNAQHKKNRSQGTA